MYLISLFPGTTVIPPNLPRSVLISSAYIGLSLKKTDLNLNKNKYNSNFITVQLTNVWYF